MQARNTVKVRDDAPLQLLGPPRLRGRGAGAVLNVMKPKSASPLPFSASARSGSSASWRPRSPAAIRSSRSTFMTGGWRWLASSALPTRSITTLSPTWSVRSARSAAAGCATRWKPRPCRRCSARPSKPSMPAGTCVLLGSARKGSEVAFEMPFLQQGRTVRGVVQGDSVLLEFIPKLVDQIMAGKFPIERMIKFYDFADINLAAQESQPVSPSSRCCGCPIYLSRRAGRGRVSEASEGEGPLRGFELRKIVSAQRRGPLIPSFSPQAGRRRS